MTEKLYESDAYCQSFDATVQACRPHGDGYALILDRTAFFPEGGGQRGDEGYIGELAVKDTREEEGEILHLVDTPCEVGAHLTCRLDFAGRFDRMQNHSGEHIVSGLAHRLHGLENVGFHLGDKETTLDLSGVLDRRQLDEIEDMANEAIFRNLPILCEYPGKEELAAMPYRAKKELSGAVRIVTIPGYDCCACCAPHVARTGEIGQIKLLDMMHYKGGVRIWLAAGRRALLSHREKYSEIATISHTLSTPQEACAAGVERSLAELAEKKEAITALSHALVEARLACLMPNAAGHILYFMPEKDEWMARKLALGGQSKAGGLCAVFFPAEAGYRFVIAAGHGGLREKAATIRTALSARGGGSDELMQGSCTADHATITAFFEQPL